MFIVSYKADYIFSLVNARTHLTFVTGVSFVIVCENGILFCRFEI